MACMGHYESCTDYKSSSWHEHVSQDADTFWCKVGCNYCNGCSCDGDDYMHPGGECTQLVCEDGEEVEVPVPAPSSRENGAGRDGWSIMDAFKSLLT